MSACCGGAPEVVLHEEVVVREGLCHLQQRDQIARLLPHLPAGAPKTLLSHCCAAAGAHRRAHDVVRGYTSSARKAVQKPLADKAKGALDLLRRSSISCIIPH